MPQLICLIDYRYTGSYTGLQDYQEAYSPYPNAHLCLRYVIEVGKVIFLDDDIDPGEMKERLPEAVDTRSHFAINDAR